MEWEKTVLGIELGSTRIKAVLLDDSHHPIASGSFEWENHFINGIWTYGMDEVHHGLQACYADLKQNVREKFGVTLTKVGAIGISGMMHGYLPLDAQGNPLTEFRTWRNTMTEEAAEELTNLLHFNIPQRWSIAHLYQAILKGEEHLPRLAHLTTLAGYIHAKLTGQMVLGIGEASGVFPIDCDTLGYDAEMTATLNRVIAQKGYAFTLDEVLPRVLTAGECAGYLTAEGAKLLDASGDLQAGIPFAPPEGDAGTGMVATNSIAVRTGNVSAGTSDFAMIVVDKLPNPHREIDIVTTPDGKPVAMIHCNNCTGDINAWVNLFAEFAEALGIKSDKGELFTLLFNKALEGEPDCGGLLSYNYLSGEVITGLNAGFPVFLRTPNAKLSLANFMRTHLLSALATLKMGLDILSVENITVDKLYAHGGYFKTPVVGQTVLSAAVGVPVSVMETAGEGGPYGMALLTAYMLWKRDGQNLASYLEQHVFADAKTSTLMANERDIRGFDEFMARYIRCLDVEKAAVDSMA